MTVIVWLSLAISIFLLVLFPFVFSEVMIAGLAKLHLEPKVAAAIVVAIFLGGLINIPVTRLPREDEVSTNPLAVFGMRGSMCRKGDCWDNAVTETLFGSMKVERLHGMRFDNRRQAKDEVIDWLGFYNHRRLHSTLAYLSPMAFERKWLADQKRIAA